MNLYKCFVYKGVVWQVTDGLGNSFYDMVPITEYLDICEKDKVEAEKKMKSYYNEALSELKSGNFNRMFYRELEKWELSPLLLRLSNSDSTVFIDENAVNNLDCKRCSFKRFVSDKMDDVIEAHIISPEEKVYIKGIKDNISPFLLTKENMFIWFKKYGSYKVSSRSDKNVIRRIYRDLNDFYSNGILFLEQLINLPDEFMEDVLRKPAWISVRDRLYEEFPNF